MTLISFPLFRRVQELWRAGKFRHGTKLSSQLGRAGVALVDLVDLMEDRDGRTELISQKRLGSEVRCVIRGGWNSESSGDSAEVVPTVVITVRLRIDSDWLHIVDITSHRN